MLIKLQESIMVHTLNAGDLQPQPRCIVISFPSGHLRKAGIGFVVLMELSLSSKL